jgi:hypothetical protein
LAGTVPAKILNRDRRQKIEVKRNAELLIGSLFTSYRPDLKNVVKVFIE